MMALLLRSTSTMMTITKLWITDRPHIQMVPRTTVTPRENDWNIHHKKVKILLSEMTMLPPL